MSNRIRTIPLDLPNAAWFRKQRHRSEDKKDQSVLQLVNSVTIKAAVELWQAGLSQTKARIEERTRGVFQWAGVRLGAMSKVTPGVKCVLPKELQPCQKP